jgi:hypothetical protein
MRKRYRVSTLRLQGFQFRKAPETVVALVVGKIVIFYHPLILSEITRINQQSQQRKVLCPMSQDGKN